MVGTDDNESGFERFVTASQDLFTAMRRNRGRLAHTQSGLTLSQLGLLEALVEDGPMPVGQIAAHAGVAGPSATRMLKQLEKAGVVIRQRSADDERKVLVSLTKHGHTLVKKQHQALRSLQRKHYTTLTPEQREVFVDVLQQMAAMIKQWGDRLR